MFLHTYQVSTVFISLDAITRNHVIRVITPYPHNFLKERENIYALKNSVNTKWNSIWRELFAIQFALQSFAPKIGNKSVCWERDNYVPSLTVASESNNTGSPDLLGPKVIKHLKTSKSQSILVVPFWHSPSLWSFL